MFNPYSVYFSYIERLLPSKLPAAEDLAAIGFLLMLIALAKLEGRFPKIKHPLEDIGQSYRANFGLFVSNSIVMSILPLSALAMLLGDHSGGGLLSVFSSPLLKAVTSFLLLDLFLYAWHRLCHSCDGLWMFHKVHHDDPALNVSTAFRIHLSESLLTGLLKTVYIVLLGIDKKVMLLYETIYSLCVMFHHANIAFPGERLLSRLLITPYLHRNHHSMERSEHDSNYGAVFSFWDHLLGTLQMHEPAVIGIKEESPQTLWGQIRFGFGFTPAPSGGLTAQLHAMIAEAAYYRAEKRSFMPGYELYDWLEAQKEIKQRIGKKLLGGC